jgi:predicted acylesterase/phospholipase RssA
MAAAHALTRDAEVTAKPVDVAVSALGKGIGAPLWWTCPVVADDENEDDSIIAGNEEGGGNEDSTNTTFAKPETSVKRRTAASVFFHDVWVKSPKPQHSCHGSGSGIGSSGGHGAAEARIVGAALSGSRRRFVTSTRHVALGGGAVYGIMYVGVLMVLCGFSRRRYAAWMANIESVAGTSAGALVGVMLAAGMDPWAMQACIQRCGLEDLLQSALDVKLDQVARVGSLSSGAAVDTLLQELMAVLTGRSDTSFLEFYAKTRRRFVCAVTNGVTNAAEFWDYRNKPHMPVWLALRCTTCLPGVFAAPLVDGTPMYDGGLTCNLPCHLFPRNATLTLFVHGGLPQECAAQTTRGKEVGTGATSAAPVPPRMLGRVLDVYTSAAQLGAMRAMPEMSIRAIPCVPISSRKHTGKLGAFALSVSSDSCNALIADGVACAYGTLLRDTLLALCLVQNLIAHTANAKPRDK